MNPQKNGTTKKENRKKVIIHAGRHKTGTSYLQQFFGKNSDAFLKNHSILYPDSGKHQYFQYHHDLIDHLGTRSRSKSEIIENFFVEVSQKDPKTILLSSEYLSRSTIDESFLNKIKFNLGNFDVSLLFYFRQPDDFLCSRYAQHVKVGVLAYPQDIMTITAELDYEKFLSRYENVFQKTFIYGRSYEVAKSTGLINDFSDWIKIPEIKNFPTPDRERIKRLPWLYLRLLWRANKLPIARSFVTADLFVSLFIKLANLLPNVFDGDRPLTNTEAENIKKENNASNERALTKYRGCYGDRT
jgi:hypothetical protein